jgi:DNA-binding transcriptional LysR family regulator
MLNTSRLEMLGLLANLGTVRAVAAALHLSPSAVSAQLAVLEAEARTPLLRRVGRRVELTPAGQALARHAGVILDQVRAAEADLAGLSGRVRLAAFSSALRALVLPVAARLRTSHPEIVLEVAELDPRASHPALRRGECDIAVTADLAGRPAATDPDVRTIPLLADDVVLVTAADGVTAAPVDLADLAGTAWSTDLPGTWLADLLAARCHAAGFEPAVAGRFASYELLLAHVEAGLSVSLLPELAVDRRYRIVTRALRDPVTRPVYAAVRRRSVLTAASQVVLDALRAQADRSPRA